MAKRVVSVLLIAVMTVAMTAAADDVQYLSDGQIWLNDTFEYQLDGSTQAGYTVVRNGHYSKLSDENGNMAILSHYSDSGTADSMYIDKNFGTIFAGKLIMECKVSTSSSSSGIKLLSAKNSSNVWLDTVNFNTNGCITACGKELCSYEKDTWYHIIIFFDTSSGEIAVTVSDSTGSHSANVSYSHRDLKAVRFQFDFSSDYSVLLDDIRIYGGSTVLTEFPQPEYNKYFGIADAEQLEKNLGDSIAFFDNQPHALVFGKKQSISELCTKNDGISYLPCSILEEKFSLQLDGEYIAADVFAEDYGYKCYEDDRGLVIISPGEKTFEASFITDVISTIIYDRPTAKQIVSSLSDTRPRICVDSAQISTLHSIYNTDDTAKKHIDYMLRSAESNLTSKPVGYYDSTARTVSQRIKNRIGIVGLAYLYTNNEAYAERLWKEAENFCSFEDWFPDDSLSHIEFLYSAAMVYDWLYGWFDKYPERRELLYNAIVEKGLKRCEKVYDVIAYGNTNMWPVLNDNINAVCNGGVLAAALSLADRNTTDETVLKCLEFSLQSSEAFLENFAPDGGWHEGFGYASYAIRYFVQALASLQNSCGTDYGISKTPGFSSATDFYIYLTAPGGIYNFHDNTWYYRRGASEMYFFANEFNKPYLGFYATKFAEEGNVTTTYLDLLFYKGGYEDSYIASDKYFRGIETAVFSTEQSYLGVHGGKVGVSHGEFDAGSFVFDAFGERFAEDLGPDSYSLTEYNTVRDNCPYYRRRSEGHNTLTVNPSEMAGQSTNGSCKITEYDSTYKKGLAVIDLTSAYEGYSVESAQRGFLYDKDAQTLLVQDEIKCLQESEIYSFVHTKADVELSPDQKTAVLTKNGKSIKVAVLSPVGALLECMDAVPLGSSPNPEGQNANDGVSKLFVRLDNVEETTIALQFLPVDGETPDTVLPISQWDISSDEIYCTFSEDDNLITASAYVDVADDSKEVFAVLAGYNAEGTQLCAADAGTFKLKKGVNYLQLQISNDNIHNCRLFIDADKSCNFKVFSKEE